MKRGFPLHTTRGGKAFFALFLVGVMVFATSAVTDAQPNKKLLHVAALTPGASLTRADEAFLDSLKNLGYVEGQNIVIDWRLTKGEAGKFSAFAADVVGRKVDCIVTRGIPAARAAKQATSTIPIVMVVNDDPVQRD